MAPERPDLACTSSVASVSSDDGVDGAARRTRKRFTNLQLTMLDELYHRTSHPTREQRETVARESGMESKSVTIWFQNRRQAERRAALHNAASSAAAASTPLTRKSSVKTPSTARRRPATAASPYPPHTPAPASASRPNLEQVASRSERRPRTPSRGSARTPGGSLWDNMPSSPLAPPSPPARELVEFGTRATLEWACAAARLAGKGRAEDGDETEEEPMEAITPMGSLAGGDPFWVADGAGKKGDKGKQKEAVKVHGDTPDEELMSAALVLCGLGRSA